MHIKRILFVSSFPPPVHGSAMVGQYIKDSQLINESFKCDYVNLSTSRGIEEIGKKTPVKIWRLFAALLLEFWRLMTCHYDLCYLAITCHGKGFLKDFPFILICKLFKKKILIHQHNKGMNADVDKWPYRRLLPIAYKDAKVILLSWRLYPDIAKIVHKDQVVICPNGIPDKNSSIKRVNVVLNLLFLSNLMESKGVLVLLDALEALKDKDIRFKCDIIGSDTKEIPNKRMLEEIANRRLQQCVFYRGIKMGKEKLLFFESADIFVHPSLDDCFPLVLLEAMQYGLPIITTNEGGIPDLVVDGENGLICEKNDPESLACCIEALMKDKALREKYGSKGRDLFEKKYSLYTFESRMKEILGSC